jgi:shikimate dehydrogenase
MKKAKFQGAQTLNGYEMLCLQAEAGWKIWSKQPETTE